MSVHHCSKTPLVHRKYFLNINYSINKTLCFTKPPECLCVCSNYDIKHVQSQIYLSIRSGPVVVLCLKFTSFNCSNEKCLKQYVMRGVEQSFFVLCDYFTFLFLLQVCAALITTALHNLSLLFAQGTNTREQCWVCHMFPKHLFSSVSDSHYNEFLIFLHVDVIVDCTDPLR